MSAEDKLFTGSDGADFVGEGATVFYNLILAVDVGEHKAGTKFDAIMIDPENGELTFQNFDENFEIKEEFVYELEYKIGKKIIKGT